MVLGTEGSMMKLMEPSAWSLESEKSSATLLPRFSTVTATEKLFSDTLSESM